MAIEILSRYTGALLYSSVTAQTIAEAVVEAVRNGANLCGANLCGPNLVRANLDGANLVRANLDGANLCGANLCGANLCGANLVRANLDGANLVRAHLVRANLCGANLCGANLDGANLCGANLDGANLCGANLCGANLVRANLDGAKTSDFTKIDRVAITLVGSRHVVTAYKDRVRIGCQERPYANWLEVCEIIGQREGYSAEEIDEYRNLILRAQSMFEVCQKEPAA